MNDVLFALWFFLPAGLANSAPVFAARVPAFDRLGIPIDKGMTYRGKRLTGDHKTVRGLLAGVIVGVAVSGIQMLLFDQSAWVRSFAGMIGYESVSILWLGAALGAGALIGDALKSFVKRQISVEPGKSWFPFDQLDYIVGGLVFSAFIVRLEPIHYVLIITLWFGLHLLSVYVGWKLHIRDKPI